MQVSDSTARVFKTHEEHDPVNLNRAREIAEMEDKVPVGIFYRNENVPRYNELRKPERVPTWDQKQAVLEKAFDKFGIFPKTSEVMSVGSGERTRN
jgi:2-oxoglutarate ferredoxin oxidoreductase subunit beta